MKVCLIFDGFIFTNIICNNVSDVEEMILALTEEELYKDFLCYNLDKHIISWKDYMKCLYFDAKKNNENYCQTFEGWTLLNFRFDRFNYKSVKVIE